MKIVFITYHNWDTKRHAGFHALAEYSCRQGCDVVFFSFSRPYYSFFMKDERLNKSVLCKLIKGQRYPVGKNSILNITWPTLSLKGRFRRLLPHFVNKWLDIHSLTPFSYFADKWLRDTDVFVFESNESVLLYKRIRKRFPNSKIVYRPSDPIVDYNPLLSKDEIKLVTKADMNFIVTDEGAELYRNAIDKFDECCKYIILHNGIYINDYTTTYKKPAGMSDNKVITYVGVEPIEWPLVIEMAKKISNADIYIITPVSVIDSIVNAIKQIPNLHYIPGIYHKDVPAWITNSDVIITPLETDFYKRRKSILISAKNLKPIAARKPIVVYANNPALSDYGITTTYNYQDFINAVSEALNEGEREYNINLDDYNWESIGELFLNTLKKL